MPPKRGAGRRYKAFDPFCTDVVRKALYNRPNGPHMGPLVLGKTRLSGLDDHYLSRSGRIKKGYRDAPIDLEKEFETEKRKIDEFNKLIAPPRKQSSSSLSSAIQKEKEEESQSKKSKKKMKNKYPPMLKNHPRTLSDDSAMLPKQNKQAAALDKAEQKRIEKIMKQTGMSEISVRKMEKELKRLDNIERRPNESFADFSRRINVQSDRALESVELSEVKPIVDEIKARNRENGLDKTDPIMMKRLKRRKRRAQLAQRSMKEKMRFKQKSRSMRRNQSAELMNANAEIDRAEIEKVLSLMHNGIGEKDFDDELQWKPEKIGFGEQADAPPRLDVPLKAAARMAERKRREKLAKKQALQSLRKKSSFKSESSDGAWNSQTTSEQSAKKKEELTAEDKLRTGKSRVGVDKLKKLSFANELFKSESNNRRKKMKKSELQSLNRARSMQLQKVLGKYKVMKQKRLKEFKLKQAMMLQHRKKLRKKKTYGM